MVNRKISTSSSQHPSNQSASSTTNHPPSKSIENPHVKRPQNSWILYRSQRLQEYRGPKKEQASYSQMLAAQWANEPAEVKEYYKMLSEKMKEEHALANPGYKYKPKSKAEKDAIREAKRLEREEEKRRKAEARSSGTMPIRTKAKRVAQQPTSGDDSSPELPDVQAESPSTGSEGHSASRSTRSSVPSKHRVASPKPNHYQPYRLPGSYYPPSAYGPHIQVGNGTYSTRLTPPPSSADATPQTLTRSLPQGHDQSSTSDLSIIFSVPASHYPAVPALGQDWSHSGPHSLPLSPPEEALTSSLPGGNSGGVNGANVTAVPILNPTDWLSLWPSLEAGFNWAGVGQLNASNAQQPILGQLDQNTEFFQWRFSADSHMDSSLPLPLLPKTEQQSDSNSCLRGVVEPKELSIDIPQSAISHPSSAIGPDQLVNGLSLSDKTAATISPSSLTPPVEAGQVPLTISFPPGFSLPPIAADSLGANGGFWDAFVASNLPDTAQNDHSGSNAANSLSHEQFGFFTGGGGPALNLNGFAGTDGGLTLDLDNLDWTTFSRLHPSDGNDEFGVSEGGDTSLADVSMRSGGTGPYSHAIGEDMDGDAGNLSFGSMVSIPSSIDEDEPRSLIHKSSSRSLRVITPPDLHHDLENSSSMKMQYVPPSGASNFATRRVAGNWKPHGSTFPSANFVEPDPNPIDAHQWGYQMDPHHQEEPLLHQPQSGTRHENFRPQPRHVSEQYNNQSFGFQHSAPRSQSAAPPSIAPYRLPAATSTMGFTPTLPSDRPPPIPPRPSTLQPS